MCFGVARIWREEPKTVPVRDAQHPGGSALVGPGGDLLGTPEPYPRSSGDRSARSRTVEMRDNRRFHEYTRQFRLMLED
jgi:hypothetical protein